MTTRDFRMFAPLRATVICDRGGKIFMLFILYVIFSANSPTHFYNEQTDIVFVKVDQLTMYPACLRPALFFKPKRVFHRTYTTPPRTYFTDRRPNFSALFSQGTATPERTRSAHSGSYFVSHFKR